MDFKDKILLLSDRIKSNKDKILTEEASKTSFILPLLQFLGYDIFDPTEVIPEYNADFGIKKGEKVDYAIMINNQPLILIEAKHHSEKLEIHGSQLFRYFSVTNSKFGILTNGIDYEFYTDLESPNLMDSKPFFKFNLTNITLSEISELKKFSKENFDLDQILSLVSDMKYSSLIYSTIDQELESPSDNFTKFFTQNCYDGRVTSKIIDQFKVLIKKSFQTYINNSISERLNISKIETKEAKAVEVIATDETQTENKVITTFEEIESYSIIKSVLSDIIDPKRIFYRDSQTYFSVVLDNNNRKTICRLYFNNNKKYLCFLDENKKEIRIQLNDINELFNYKEDIINYTNKLK